MSRSRSARVLSAAVACAFALTAQAAAKPGSVSDPASRRAYDPAAKSVPAAPLSFTNKVINPSSVNNPGADATAQDTQSETVRRGERSNVVVGFNDSGAFIGGASKFTGFANSTNSGGSFTDRGTLADQRHRRRGRSEPRHQLANGRRVS